MPLRNSTFGETKPVIEHGEQRVVDHKGLVHKRLDRRFHSPIDRGWVGAVNVVWPGQGIVLGDVDKLSGIGCASFIGRVGTRVLIPAVKVVRQWPAYQV